MLTRKFYQRMADTLGASAGPVLCSHDYMQLVADVRDILADTNPAFDAMKFEAACSAARALAVKNAAKKVQTAS